MMGAGTEQALRREGERLYFFGVRVDSLDRRSALDRIGAMLAGDRAGGSARVYFTNVHSIHLARRDEGFRRVLNSGDLVLGDGSGLLLASRLLGDPLRENLNGTDFTPVLLGLAERRGWSVFLLGARPEVLAACRDALGRTFPALRLAGARHGYFGPAEEPDVIAEVNAAAPDLLLCALGSPRQELFLAEHAARLRVGASLAVGGLFDFLSGDKPRAPLWMRRMGLEFLFRLLADPRHKWQRVFVEIPEFLARLLGYYVKQRVTDWRAGR